MSESFHPTSPDAPTFLVTGGTSGIGLETARQLAQRGTVLITGRDVRRGEAAARELSTYARTVRFLPADHSTRAGNLDLAARAAALAPRLDVLVNNAGGDRPPGRG